MLGKYLCSIISMSQVVASCPGFITSVSAQEKAMERDVRAALAQETERFKVGHLLEAYLAPKHRPPELVGESKSASRDEVLGGVGYGYWLRDSELHWDNSTEIDFFAIIPRTAGGNMSYFLYLTASNRSNLGVEALVLYYQQDEARFTVYDWARPEGDRWQTSINLLTSHPEYVTIRPDEFGNPRQMCRVQNATTYAGPVAKGHGWDNRVRLFNFDLGVWDLVYSYKYTTSTKDENTYEDGEYFGSWGPIIEIWTEESAYDNLNTMGFDLIRLFQDGDPASQWLTPSNSSKGGMAFFNEITRTENRGFVVYTGPTDPDGDGYDNAHEVMVGTDPDSGLSFFRVSGLAWYPAANEVGITIESVSGRLYRLYSTASLRGSWSAVGEPAPGTAGLLELRCGAGVARQFYRIDAGYNVGTLCVTVNRDEAEFTLTPTAGTIPPYWSQTPNRGLYDKCVVGIPAGPYLLTFEPVAGVTTPASQWIRIASGELTEAEGFYMSR